MKPIQIMFENDVYKKIMLFKKEGKIVSMAQFVRDCVDIVLKELEMKKNKKNKKNR